jgi:hypothetical protein
MADARPLSERLAAAWVLAQTDSGEHIDPGLLHEAAELARRVEAAPVLDLRKNAHETSAIESRLEAAGYYHGKRVALVEVPDA